MSASRVISETVEIHLRISRIEKANLQEANPCTRKTVIDARVLVLKGIEAANRVRGHVHQIIRDHWNYIWIVQVKSKEEHTRQ